MEPPHLLSAATTRRCHQSCSRQTPSAGRNGCDSSAENVAPMTATTSPSTFAISARLLYVPWKPAWCMTIHVTQTGAARSIWR